MIANLMSVAEIAKKLGVTDRTVRRWIDDGWLRAEKYGDKLWKVTVADYNAFCSYYASEIADSIERRSQR